MALAPKSSPRRFDVLQQRLDELATQQRATAQRASTYQRLETLSPLEQITAIKSDPAVERLQYAFNAPSGDELRAALLEQTADLPPTKIGRASCRERAADSEV